MNLLDWIFVAILALLGVRCMIKGFIAEVLSVAAILVGLLAGLFLYKPAGALLVGWGLKSQPEILPSILGFAAVFLVAFLLVKLVERLLKEGIEAAELGGLDRALGLVLGLAEGIVLVSLVVVAMSLIQPAFKSVPGYSKLTRESTFTGLILPVVGPSIAEATKEIKAPEIKVPELKLQLKPQAAPTGKKP
jgi:membrane protein required for colicin V production